MYILCDAFHEVLQQLMEMTYISLKTERRTFHNVIVHFIDSLLTIFLSESSNTFHGLRCNDKNDDEAHLGCSSTTSFWLVRSTGKLF